MKPLYTLIFSLILGGLAVAQPQGPSMQVQGRRGSVNLGIGPDGRPYVNANGRRGSVQMLGGGLTSGTSGWNNATLSRGPQGELIVTDPNQGSIVQEPGGRIHLQTREGNFILDPSMWRR